MRKWYKKTLALMFALLVTIQGVNPSMIYAEGEDVPADNVQGEENTEGQSVEEAMTPAPEAPVETENTEDVFFEETPSAEETPEAEMTDENGTDEELPEEPETPADEQVLQEEQDIFENGYVLDFTSKRIIVGTENSSVIREGDPVISEYNNVYLMQFETTAEAQEAYSFYKDAADFVTVDFTITVADPESETEGVDLSEPMTEANNPIVQLTDQIEEDQKDNGGFFSFLKPKEEKKYTIALIDTGAAYDVEDDTKVLDGNISSAVSMLGDDVFDDNGHGTSMLRYIVNENPNANVLSIKALDSDGHGTASSVYAAMEYAIENNADIINLSISAFSTMDNAVIAEEVKKANEAGIIVVGSAGNDYNNVKYYIPGNIEEAVIVGSCDNRGVKLEYSNFGDTVDFNAISGSTSEAAARVSGMLSKDEITPEGISEWYEGVKNRENGILFDCDFNGEGYVPEPEKQDGDFSAANVTSIETLYTQYKSGGKTRSGSSEIWRLDKENGTWSKVTSEDDKYAWNAVSNTKGHSFAFRVNYATSGIKTMPAHTIEIRIPLHLLRDRDGNFADVVEMSVLTEEEYLADDPNNHRLDQDKYAYRIDEEHGEIIFTNMEEIGAAQNGYFEVSYSLSKAPIEYYDMCESDDFKADMTIVGTELTANDVLGPVFIDTGAEIKSTVKKYPSMLKWRSEWGEKPADADNYIYLEWQIVSTISDVVTQPYNLIFTDTTSASFGDDKVEPILIKYSGINGYQPYDDSHRTVQSKTSYKRYESVVTRHLKSDVEDLAKYEITNNIKIDLIPIDGIDEPTVASSKAVFKWERPFYAPPVGHFMTHKTADGHYRATRSTQLTNLGNNAGYYSRYDLEDFKDGTITEYNGFDYAVWIDGYPAQWTYLGTDTLDPENYFKLPVRYALEDEGVYLSEDGGTGESRALTSEDFEFYRLTFNERVNDAVLDESTLKYNVIPGSYDEGEVLNIYVKQNNNNTSWKLVGKYDLKNNTFIDIDNTVIASTGVSGIKKTIDFAGNVVAYKLESSSAKHYYVEIDAVPLLKLKRSSFVTQTIKDWDSIGIRNEMVGRFYRVTNDDPVDPTWEMIVSYKGSDKDYARIYLKDSELTKRPVASSNDKRKKQYTISWRSHAEETGVGGATGVKEYIRQNSGTFFDLIPAGQHVKSASVAVRNENGYLSSTDYTVKITDNYKGTGQELLEVFIEEPGDYYDIFFDTTISWDAIHDYGEDVYNAIAFETGNHSIKYGRPNDGGTIEAAQLMADLPSNNPVTDPDAAEKIGENNPNRYLYGEARFDITVLTQATSGLTKLIREENDDNYSYDTETVPNGKYYYRWRYANSYITKAKDLILFDTLENYVIEEDGDKSDWHGIPQYLDVSLLQQLDIAPVVYISTIENLDLSREENHDITNTDVWQVAGSDISGAKAIAVDMRKKTNGDDFVLGYGESLSVVLAMKAPASASSEKQRIPIAYNNIYVDNTVIDMQDHEEHFYIHHDYTSIKFVVKADVNGYKVCPEEEKPLENIVFRLTGTSDYGTEYDLKSTSNRKGIFTFKNVERGTYKVYEFSGTSDYLEDHTEHTVLIDGLGNVFIDGVSYPTVDQEMWTVENKPRIHADIKIVKRDSVTNATIGGVTFKLSGTSDYGNEIVEIITTSGAGRATIKDIERGTYRLTELETDENHILPKKGWIVVVDETGEVNITAEE